MLNKKNTIGVTARKKRVTKIENCGVHNKKKTKTSAPTTMTENAGQSCPTALNPAWALQSSCTFAASLFTVWHGA